MPGYIWWPSGGTLSSANGTTSPIVTSLRIPCPRSSLDAGRAGRLQHLAPAHDLTLDVVTELAWRADHRLPAESREVRLGVDRCHDVLEGAIELGHDRRWRVGRRHGGDP